MGMKVTREQAVQNRERVVETAAKLFREHGFGGIGVADLMKSAGLTHGGFYGNFGSKEALMAESVSYAMDKSLQSMDKLDGMAPADRLGAFAGAYLSPAHRDTPGNGCCIAALGPEVARVPAVKRSLTEGVRKQVDKLTTAMAPATGEEQRQAALVAMASMVGALVLARAVDDQALSDEFLTAVHSALTGG
jgi:TetR/AcrR family transcriptional regulator, transcriptional repressor for nem operon